MEAIIEIKHVNKYFGSHEVLKDIDFSVKKEKSSRLSVPPDRANQRCFDASIYWKSRAAGKLCIRVKTF